MKNSVKVSLSILAISAIFLVIAVDYIPHIIAWMPLLLTGYLSLNNEEFVDWVTKKIDNLI